MKVIRFIGIEELKSLVGNGEVVPLHKMWHNAVGRGVVKEKPVLWFFPFVSTEDFLKKQHKDWLDRELDSPFDRLSYCSSVVADLWANIAGEKHVVSICLHLNLPKKDLVEDIQPYADPDGSFFDTTSVLEYLLYRPYKAAEVEMVELYYTYAENPREASIGLYRKPLDALEFLMPKIIKEYAL